MIAAPQGTTQEADEDDDGHLGEGRTELATTIAAKEATASEVVEAHLAKIAAVNPTTGARTAILADDARAAAAAAAESAAAAPCESRPATAASARCARRRAGFRWPPACRGRHRRWPSSCSRRPGPLAWTVGDLTLMYHAMLNGDPRDPVWIPALDDIDPVLHPVAVTTSDADADADPEVSDALRRAADALADVGHRIPRRGSNASSPRGVRTADGGRRRRSAALIRLTMDPFQAVWAGGRAWERW